MPSAQLDWFFKFLRHQLFIKLPYPGADFSRQTIIVTGSNTGLGLEAARHLYGHPLIGGSKRGPHCVAN
jgi:hypothetical protein